MRIGLFGGTFDPVHLGHLIVAEECRTYLGLEEVVFLPAGRPWMKEGQELAPAGCRLDMLRLAVGCNPFFRVVDIELERLGPTYTIDTLRDLVPRFQDDADFYFILGADSFASFERWKEPGEILGVCRLAVVARPGEPECDLGKLEQLRPQGSQRGVVVPVPQIGISASDVRSRVREARSIRYHVTIKVEDYIWAHRLYG